MPTRSKRSSPPPPAESVSTGGEISPGVRELDHTADVGIVIEARSLEELLRRAATGMWRLVFAAETEGAGVAAESPAPPDDGRGGGGSVPGAGDGSAPAADTSGGPTRELRIEAEGPDTLLLRWLQELLYIYEVEGLVPREVEFSSVEHTSLLAVVTWKPAERTPVLDIKGVTYHGLEARPTEDGWRGQVIFDI